MRKPIQATIIFLLAVFLSVSVSFATSGNVIFSEDFSQDLSKWSPIRDDGRYWKIANQKLESYIPFGSTVTEMIPKLEFMQPLENYVFELDYTPLQGGDRTISFGVIDKNNWYEIHFAPQLTHIVKLRDGKVTWSETHQYTLQNGNTYRMALVFVEGKITLLMNGTQLFQTIDTTYTPTLARIAVKAATGGIFPTKVIFDNILVRSVQSQPQTDGTQLGVTILKQDDPEWGNLEYDSASVWASTLAAGSTIKDWGCNLVSLVMLLQYHNISYLPDGSSITPITLNDWLVNHKGFYGNPPSGNINRQSISQLTAEISKVYQTPKLEFLYVGENLLETAVTEIENGNPVILELDGHFVIADGFTDDKSDLYIKDPAYDVTKLSEHPLALKSVRTFTPSYTDLSYISIISDSDLGIQLSGSVSYTEQTRAITTNGSPTYTTQTFITEVAKPESQTYEILINNSTTQNQEATIHTYSVDGHPQLFTVKVEPGNHVYHLLYDKNGSSTFQQQNENASFSYQDFRQTIIHLFAIDEIKHAYLEKILLGLVTKAEAFPTNQQRKLLTLVKTIVTYTPKSQITEMAQALLLDQIKLLMAAIK